MKDAVIIVDPDVRINQQIVLGFSEELQKQDNWDIHVLSGRNSFSELKSGIHSVGADAIAVRRPSDQLIRHIESLNIPYVIIADEGMIAQGASVVLPDNETMGRMAAEYLLALKFEHFAVLEYDKPESDSRIGVFWWEIERRGKTLDTFRLPLGVPNDHPFRGYGSTDALVKWLQDLPKPCALFAHSDQPGAFLIRTCVRNGIRVPEDISVLGVDDDPLFCRTVKPNLASLHVPNARIGTEAARMILNWVPGRRLLKVPPSTVVERASVRAPRRGDPLVDMALEHLRAKVAKGVRVRDLQKLTGLSPHQLIYRFQVVTGRTPMEMILQRRIDVAKQLLAEATAPVAWVARQCGFNSATQFYVTFRKQVGMSPRDYRAQFAP